MISKEVSPFSGEEKERYILENRSYTLFPDRKTKSNRSIKERNTPKAIFIDESNSDIGTHNESLRIDYHGRVRYDPLFLGLAGYYPVTSEIVLGVSSALLTMESLSAVLSHERTHYLFRGLSSQDQITIAKAFIQYDLTQLESVYAKLKVRYSDGYFGVALSTLKAMHVKLNGNRELGIYPWKMPVGKDREEVDLVMVANEVLAYANSESSADDHFGKGSTQKLSKACKALLATLPEDILLYLKERGFFSIDISAQVVVLLQNPIFMRDRQKRSGLSGIYGEGKNGKNEDQSSPVILKETYNNILPLRGYTEDKKFSLKYFKGAEKDYENNHRLASISVWLNKKLEA